MTNLLSVEQFHALQEQIVKELGEEWSYQRPDPNFMRRDYGKYTNGVITIGVSQVQDHKGINPQLEFGWVRQQEYFDVYVSVPVTNKYGGISHDTPVVSKIKVSSTKTPVQIARDVLKRIVPRATEVDAIYRESVGRYCAGWEKQNAYRNQVNSLFANTTLLTWRNHNLNKLGYDECPKGNVYKNSENTINLTIEIRSGSLDLEGYVSHDLGLKILSLIRDEAALITG